MEGVGREDIGEEDRPDVTSGASGPWLVGDSVVVADDIDDDDADALTSAVADVAAGDTDPLFTNEDNRLLALDFLLMFATLSKPVRIE